MAEVIRMPLLSDTMKEGVIAEWHKEVGDKVKSDDVLAEVETDKATMEVMPYVDGVLLYRGVEKGKGVPVNGIMAIVGKEGEDYQALLKDEEGKQMEGNEAADAPEKLENSDNSTPEKVEGVENKPVEPKKEIPKKEAAPIPKGVTVVRMPLLSDTMKAGKIESWLKNKGDKVKSDDAIAEVETDKATMEVMGYADGTLLHIGVPAGESAKINAIIAIIGPEGTDISGILSAEKEGGQSEEDNEAQNEAEDSNKDEQENEVKQSAPESSSEVDMEDDDERLKISPLARRMATDKGIKLSTLKGTGDGGRIIKRDIESYNPANAPAASTAKRNAAPIANNATAQQADVDIPISQMRKIIAQRLSESKFQAPHFYLTISVNMDMAMQARKGMNELSEKKISFNDLIIKACAMSLRRHPAANSSWLGETIRQNGNINIGTAVAVDEGLIVPVVKNADQKSLSQIATEASELIGKARNKKLQPPEFTGNTFTISNLGMMDIDEFTAIINPPDSCILAVGKIAETPIVKDGQLAIGNIMKLTLSCDHRVVDGALGAAFLQTLKSFLENPVNMLV